MQVASAADERSARQSCSAQRRLYADVCVRMLTYAYVCRWLRQLMSAARARAAQLCVASAEAQPLVLQDAAACFYWAERDLQEAQGAQVF
jgi:hypothetical protein